MTAFREPLRILSSVDLESIHECALRILGQVGMQFFSPEALVYLKRAGCRIDEASCRAWFPAEVVNGAVERMRQGYANLNRVPRRMSVRYSHVRFVHEPHRIHQDFTTSAGGFCAFILDTHDVRRYAHLQDVRKAINLVNALPHIDYTGLPVSAQEVPGPLRPVAMAAELARYTTKIGGVETFSKADVSYLIDIGEIISNGSQRLKEAPVFVGYAEVRSPLAMDTNMVEIFMEYVRKGFPQTVDTMPSGGATAPVTAAGNLALAMAETLGPLVLGFSIDPDAILGVDIIPANCDMKTGMFRYASAERLPLLAARVQLISEFYGCPSGVHGGKTDSCFPNIQAGIEKASTMIFPLLAGAVGIGTVGHLENAVTFSPLQLVIDNEIAGYVHRSLRGIEVNEETLAFDVTKSAVEEGQVMSNAHTLRHFRDELFLSPLFEGMPWDSAHSQERPGMEAKARACVEEHWKLPEPVLSDEQSRALDAVVARAAKELL
jgi:trimethylamine--corrinoid protein Co-methyltransferase